MTYCRLSLARQLVSSTDEGLRILLMEDGLIFAVRDSDGLIYCYDTRTFPVVPLPVAKLHLPQFYATTAAHQMTLSEWQTMQPAAEERVQ